VLVEVGVDAKAPAALDLVEAAVVELGVGDQVVHAAHLL